MYVNTVAHHTASAARHGGDPTWIRRQGSVMEGLGFIQAIPAIVSIITGLATTTYGIIEARKDKKDAESDAKKAKKKAAAEAAAVAQLKIDSDRKVAEAQAAQQMETKQATIGLGTGALVTAALVGGYFFLRSRTSGSRRRKR
jgi:flagellar biosynthesis component FlhA